ncbi:MAG: HAD family hydrolase [Bacteroidales bacterium]|nr:HAD family hydrolase [Bacteroidales bacterium]
MNLKNLTTKDNWSVFIDRDGVINRRIIGNYVKHIEDFHFLDGVLDTITNFQKYFKYIFIVTNQQGVGKGEMSTEDLKNIHDYMLQQIISAGGRVDAIYFCPALKDSGDKCRKPEIGMALSAQKDFPEVDFSKSIMIGDSISDMAFGKNAGMKTIFVDAQDKGVKPANADQIIHRLNIEYLG